MCLYVQKYNTCITCVTKKNNTNCSNITLRLSKIDAIRQNKRPQESEVLFNRKGKNIWKNCTTPSRFYVHVNNPFHTGLIYDVERGLIQKCIVYIFFLFIDRTSDFWGMLNNLFSLYVAYKRICISSMFKLRVPPFSKGQ